tara:strand:- start:293 stop:718 length:426 start_codon:yes stop_codon:yes gene_type:complete
MNSIPVKQPSIEFDPNNPKKYLYMAIGFAALFMAYVGVITPGIPFTGFLIIAAWAFGKSSEKWHNYLYTHSIFGPFLHNWETERVFPRKARYLMMLSMWFSSTIVWITTKSIVFTGAVVLIMILAILWTNRYPESPSINTM